MKYASCTLCKCFISTFYNFCNSLLTDLLTDIATYRAVNTAKKEITFLLTVSVFKFLSFISAIYDRIFLVEAIWRNCSAKQYVVWRNTFTK